MTVFDACDEVIALLLILLQREAPRATVGERSLHSISNTAGPASPHQEQTYAHGHR